MRKEEKEKLYQRERIKATIEASRISRMGDKSQKDILNKLKEQKMKVTGLQYERVTTLIDILTEKQNQKEEARANQTYAQYNDGHGYGTSGGSGTDNG